MTDLRPVDTGRVPNTEATKKIKAPKASEGAIQRRAFLASIPDVGHIVTQTTPSGVRQIDIFGEQPIVYGPEGERRRKGKGPEPVRLQPDDLASPLAALEAAGKNPFRELTSHATIAAAEGDPIKVRTALLTLSNATRVGDAARQQALNTELVDFLEHTPPRVLEPSPEAKAIADRLTQGIQEVLLVYGIIDESGTILLTGNALQDALHAAQRSLESRFKQTFKPSIDYVDDPRVRDVPGFGGEALTLSIHDSSYLVPVRAEIIKHIATLGEDTLDALLGKNATVFSKVHGGVASDEWSRVVEEDRAQERVRAEAEDKARRERELAAVRAALILAERRERQGVREAGVLEKTAGAIRSVGELFEVHRKVSIKLEPEEARKILAEQAETPETAFPAQVGTPPTQQELDEAVRQARNVERNAYRDALRYSDVYMSTPQARARWEVAGRVFEGDNVSVVIGTAPDGRAETLGIPVFTEMIKAMALEYERASLPESKRRLAMQLAILSNGSREPTKAELEKLAASDVLGLDPALFREMRVMDIDQVWDLLQRYSTDGIPRTEIDTGETEKLRDVIGRVASRGADIGAEGSMKVAEGIDWVGEKVKAIGGLPINIVDIPVVMSAQEAERILTGSDAVRETQDPEENRAIAEKLVLEAYERVLKEIDPGAGSGNTSLLNQVAAMRQALRKVTDPANPYRNEMQFDTGMKNDAGEPVLLSLLFPKIIRDGLRDLYNRSSGEEKRKIGMEFLFLREAAREEVDPSLASKALDLPPNEVRDVKGINFAKIVGLVGDARSNGLLIKERHLLSLTPKQRR